MKKDYWENIEIGDKEAYSEAYLFYYKKLYNYGRKFTNDNHLIEDAVDEVFLMIWVNRQNIGKIKSPQSYIFSCFRNKIFRNFKEHKSQQLGEAINMSNLEFSVDNNFIKKEADSNLQRRIQKALQQLTLKQKEAIFLRFYEELSYAEIASIMNISIKSTYKLIARALKGLKDILYILEISFSMHIVHKIFIDFLILIS